MRIKIHVVPCAVNFVNENSSTSDTLGKAIAVLYGTSLVR